jgi:hypothetical protein
LALATIQFFGEDELAEGFIFSGFAGNRPAHNTAGFVVLGFVSPLRIKLAPRESALTAIRATARVHMPIWQTPRFQGFSRVARRCRRIPGQRCGDIVNKLEIDKAH